MSKEQLNLSAVCDVTGGEVARDARFGNLGFAIHDGPDLLTWAETRKNIPEVLRNKQVSAVIAPQDVALSIPDSMGLLIHDQPREAFYRLHNHLAQRTPFYGTRNASTIHPSARVAPDSHVDPEGVVIAEGVVIETGARILAGSRIGPRAIVRAGAVIGSQGFQFVRLDGEPVSVEHAGGVRVEEDAEIYANANVSKAIFRGDTRIGRKVKIDALVHIAHNARIGDRTVICAGSVISGSVVIGEDVYIGPGATITNCIRIGDRARVTLGSVVVRSVAAGQHVTGHWAVPHDVYLRGFGRLSVPDKSGGDK